MKKAELIRKGLADHPDMKPKELAEKLAAEAKKNGFEIKPNEISVYKSKAGKKPAQVTPKAAKAPAATEANGTPDAVTAAKEVKKLVDKFGADTVQGLAALFAGK